MADLCRTIGRAKAQMAEDPNAAIHRCRNRTEKAGCRHLQAQAIFRTWTVDAGISPYHRDVKRGEIVRVKGARAGARMIAQIVADHPGQTTISAAISREA
jgi:hypothetical protein